MIHGGLHLVLSPNRTVARHCCLRSNVFPVDINTNFWHSKDFIKLRNINIANQWDPDCKNCQLLESCGQPSFRTGMNQGLGITGQINLTGPARIDLTFDLSCNLACRTCGPISSTYWQKHLKEHNLWNKPITTPKNKHDVIAALSKLDLSNLKMLVFCGGETLLGQEYWDVAAWLADNVPNAKQQLTVCFQTNGTQTISPRNYSIIDQFFLVKIHVSLDGIEQQFNYLRWPASWAQVTDNILQLKHNAPSNVMFLVEETISIFNLATTSRLSDWLAKNFQTNRGGDLINHTQHLAHGIFGLHALSREYVDYVSATPWANIVPSNFVENPRAVAAALAQITQVDSMRNENFKQVFPEMANCYTRFTNQIN